MALLRHGCTERRLTNGIDRQDGAVVGVAQKQVYLYGRIGSVFMQLMKLRSATLRIVNAERRLLAIEH